MSVDDFDAGPEPDWTLEGDERPRALDAIERAIVRPSAFRAPAQLRDELEARRDATRVELGDLDAQIAGLVARRRALVGRIRACNLAIAGTGEIRHRRTGEVIQRLGRRERIPIDDPQPTVPPAVARVVSGRPLLDAIVDALHCTGQPLTISEIERLLRIEGIVPSGRSSQTISNALRGAVRAGSVVRVSRGRYQVR